MKQTKTAKITALIALLAIISWIVWTWILIIYETVYWPENQQISQEDLNKLLEQYNNSWATTQTWINLEYTPELTQTGVVN